MDGDGSDGDDCGEVVIDCNGLYFSSLFLFFFFSLSLSLSLSLSFSMPEKYTVNLEMQSSFGEGNAN